METDISNIYNVSEHDRLLKASEVAEMLNIGLSFAYKLMREGEIPSIKLGRAVRVRHCDLKTFINDNVRFG